MSPAWCTSRDGQIEVSTSTLLFRGRGVEVEVPEPPHDATVNHSGKLDVVCVQKVRAKQHLDISTTFDLPSPGLEQLQALQLYV